MTDTAELIARLQEPVDWAHFVSDDHALDYQVERFKVADALSSLVRERDELRRVNWSG